MAIAESSELRNWLSLRGENEDVKLDRITPFILAERGRLSEELRRSSSEPSSPSNLKSIETLKQELSMLKDFSDVTTPLGRDLARKYLYKRFDWAEQKSNDVLMYVVGREDEILTGIVFSNSVRAIFLLSQIPS
ncbi:MAG: hypothetical protein Q7R49_01600 [Candidatus Daviesbacteria bacterium]|nr:hypothetical protein [Candidatus Daviesbacteria bacterium]